MIEEPEITPISEQEAARAETGGIARAATILALGNIASRVLGLARDTVKSHLFGALGPASALEVASVVPRIFFDLLVGGMVSSALVPVFSEYAVSDRREELWHLSGLLIAVFTAALSVFVLVVEVFAPQVAWLLSGGFDPQLMDLTVHLLRICAPAMLFLNLAGVLSALLYAMKRFTLPAFTAAAFNASQVVLALLLWRQWGVASMAVGVLLGAIIQVALQLPSLRGAHVHLDFNWRHPGLQRIVKLYIPVVLGLVVSQVVVGLSYNLASHTGPNSIAWIDYATAVTQFPLGLVATAVSIAILPSLSHQAAKSPMGTAVAQGFHVTLAQGLKLVLILMIPATIGLFILSRPIIALIYEHGVFTPADTAATSGLLRWYLIGATFAAVDQPLIFAFYARKDTLTPALVGVVGVGIYLLAALAPTLFRPLQVDDLAMANSVQLLSHALIMLWLLGRRMGGLAGRGVGVTAVKSLLASLAMGIATYGTLMLVESVFPATSLMPRLLAVAVPAAIGLLVYGLLMRSLDVDEVKMVQGMVQSRLRI